MDIGTFAVQIATAFSILAGIFTSIKLNKKASNENELVRSRRVIADLQADVLSLQGYGFSLRNLLSTNGIATPDPPQLKSTDPSGGS